MLAAAALPPPPAPVPRVTGAGLAAARRYAAARPGHVAFAVLRPGGRIEGLHPADDFPSASVSKAMLLVAALRHAADRPVVGDEQERLRAMVTRSDNAAARQVHAALGGDVALTSVARAAGMRAFRPTGFAFGPRITPADQVRLFVRLDALVPARHRPLAAALLGGIVAEQRWGIAPVAARRHLRIRFKGGWREGLIHQVALLRRGDRRLAIAVLADEQPSMRAGEATIEGIAARLVER